MTPANRAAEGGGFAGKYTDDQEGVFDWTCPAPPAAAAAAADGASTLAVSIAGVISLAALNM